MDDRRGVRETYERIAEHFAATREHPWPEVESFCEDRRGALALDVGCGNGRHAGLLAGRADRVVCLDASRRLLGIARDRLRDATGGASRPTSAVTFLSGDAAALPLVAHCVDLGLYVATLHHLPTQGLRRASLDELARVLAPGGAALVSVWSTAHERFADASATDEEGFDAELDWTLADGSTVPRYYHVYAPAEFEADLGSSALTVTRSFVSSGNCYSVVTG